jgi:amino acid adenylation domain-containing protein
VPLDPTYPRDRLAFMLDDSQTSLLLTQKKFTSITDVSELNNGIQRIYLDLEWPTTFHTSPLHSGAAINSENLAYVIYTSGSTGKPKGVQITHRSLFNFIMSMAQLFNVREQDVLLAVTTLSFDIAGLEIFLPIICGAKIIIASHKLAADGSGLSIALNQTNAITMMQATPETWRLLLASNWKGNPQLKILCGGEALPRDLAMHLQKKSKEVWNLYGPTETTIWSTVYRLSNDISFAKVIPIGRPIANTQLYILDKHLQLVPIGVAGVLHIGGDGLARGYLNRPELTAEKFIRHPFSDDSQARLYKTGDLTHYLPDGTIEFLGRIDHQVKLRGFRIELGEIESILGQHPTVNQALVTVLEDQPDDKRLVAYLTHPQNERPNLNALRLFLKEKLPKYMVPSVFVLLDKFPLTPNGKIDRKALPTPDKTNIQVDQCYVPPLSPIEEMLVAIWREVLKVDKISIHDNFFELGGHSLLALVLCRKIEAKIGKPFPLEWIFQFPTANLLSGKLEEHINIEGKKFNPIVTGFQIEGTKPLFWGFHGGHVVSMILEHLGANQPVYLLNHQSIDGNRAKYLTVPEMASFYLQNILEIDPDGPYYLSGYSMGGMVMYEVARQLCELGKTVAMLFMVDPSSIGHVYFPRQKLTLRRIYNELKNIGCISYFRNSLRDIRIQIYFSLGILLPARYHWTYMWNIYRHAIQCYQPGLPLKGIEKAVMIHGNNREIENWINLFNGKIESHAIDCNHNQMIENPYIEIWLKILDQAINEFMRASSNDK